MIWSQKKMKNEYNYTIHWVPSLSSDFTEVTVSVGKSKNPHCIQLDTTDIWHISVPFLQIIRQKFYTKGMHGKDRCPSPCHEAI
jgi:hypothetical protein